MMRKQTALYELLYLTYGGIQKTGKHSGIVTANLAVLSVYTILETAHY